MSSQDLTAALSAKGNPQATPPYPDHDQGPLLVRVVWVLIGISAATVLGRLWTKLQKTHRLYWDDFLMLVALAFGIVFSSMVTVAVSSGLGRHMLYLSEAEHMETLHIGTLSLAYAFLSPMAGRMAFCVTLLYLAGTDPKVKKWPIWTMLTLQFVVNVATIIVFYSQCGSDINLLWSMTDETYTKCGNPQIQTDFGYFQGAFNTLTDLFLTALPAILIEHTRLSVKAKLGLACLLCLSILAMIASIVKTYEARALSEVLDYTWDLCPYVIWLSIELNVVIIVSSIPLLRPLFRRTIQQRVERQHQQGWATSTFDSVFSKKGLSRVDSQEYIVRQHGSHYPPIQMRGIGNNGITVTTEVSVTFQPTDMPYVHAALVGLVQGEIANPRQAQR
ncbi:Uu.00g135170.m01.CDS01 [Anthostomella pinea]|uniref:Uu.00g135170.m01.CDS01 n=1 Tax=Anthostomella pinea TaxID=933095 RepID=A0AAI8YKV6_9PEZI|nr:Uu.00g135170.m01.CDS01 [Anthostomella pinea]